MHYDGTRWQSAMPAGSPSASMQDIDMITPEEGWAVGARGTILHYNGSGWAAVDSPAPNAMLNAIDMVSAQEGWAVGYDDSGTKGVILHYSKGVWTRLPSIPSSGDLYLNDISMVSLDEGWAVGTETLGDASTRRYAILRYRSGTWSLYDR